MSNSCEINNSYDKMEEYISSVFNVFLLVNTKAEQQQDKKLKVIALVIFNYIRYMAKEHEIDLRGITQTENVSLLPIFEYLTAKNIQLYDFSNIKMEDVDTSKKEDLERFVLSHIYYITQGKK